MTHINPFQFWPIAREATRAEVCSRLHTRGYIPYKIKRLDRSNFPVSQGGYMKEFIGKNPSFKALWNCTDQTYKVYKDGKFIVLRHRFEDIKCYLN